MIYTTLKKEVLQKYKNPYFLETGTANADCVRLALEVGFEKVFSIEIDETLQNENIKNYKPLIDLGKVSLTLGDSLLVIKSLISELDKPTTFWLDAHVDFGPNGVKRCPLYEELDAIKTSQIKNHTILIDDVRVFGSHWGEGIELQTLKTKLQEINSNYKFAFEDGHVKNDILVAFL